jgi:Ca2+:H+ antiporter
VLRQPRELGLVEKDQVLLALMLLVGVITLGTGRTTVLQGSIQVIFAVFCSSPRCDISAVTPTRRRVRW